MKYKEDDLENANELLRKVRKIHRMQKTFLANHCYSKKEEKKQMDRMKTEGATLDETETNKSMWNERRELTAQAKVFYDTYILKKNKMIKAGEIDLSEEINEKRILRPAFLEGNPIKKYTREEIKKNAKQIRERLEKQMCTEYQQKHSDKGTIITHVDGTEDYYDLNGKKKKRKVQNFECHKCNSN